MSGPNGMSRSRRSRPLSAQEKYQIWQQLLTGELTQRGAAEQWSVDPTTIMRIRKVGREGALAALAQSKPGRQNLSVEDAELQAARAEIARLEETVKEQAIELVALRGKRARAGRPDRGSCRCAGQARAARSGGRDDRRRLDVFARVPAARARGAPRPALADARRGGGAGRPPERRGRPGRAGAPGGGPHPGRCPP